MSVVELSEIIGKLVCIRVLIAVPVAMLPVPLGLVTEDTLLGTGKGGVLKSNVEVEPPTLDKTLADSERAPEVVAMPLKVLGRG